MPTLFQVTEREITQLANHKLRPILNELLRMEARQYGIPSTSVETTSEDNISDDGIDARIDHQVIVPSDCRIPMGLSVWQYKAGDTSPAAIRKESKKPGIQAAIVNDGSYCFVVAQSNTDRMRRSREAALDQAFKKAGKPPKRRLLTATEIAEWVSDYPVIARLVLGFEVSDEFHTFVEWNKLPQSGTNVEFQTNTSRTNIINGIVNLLNSRSEPTSIRLAGSDGAGKTRLILEAIRVADAANLTFYASTPDAVPEDFFSFVETRTSIHRLILVVDECDGNEFRILWQRAHRCNGRVVLITIGSEPSHTGELERNVFSFLLDILTNETIHRIIQLAAPSLNWELQHYFARIVDGSVKLAIALAESIVQNENIDTISGLISLSNNIQVILRSLWKTEEERDAMYTLSLLRYIGLDDEVAKEGETVAQFLHLDFMQLKRIAIQMQQRGLVIKKGRYRYVTPSLLAVWFAKELWEAHGSDIISTLLSQLPFIESRYRLLQRLGDIGEERFAAPLIEALFGRGGEWANIDSLDDAGVANLLNLLTNASPITCSRVLERIFRTVSRERLVEFKKGRHNIISALQSLLKRTETFYQAARILRRLAEIENESLPNDASEIWLEIFYSHLGLSPVPAWERHTLIEEAILHSNPIETRILGIRAIAFSLETDQLPNYGYNPGGHLPQLWRPQNPEDVLRTYRSALSLLEQVLTDADERVEQQAISILIGSFRSLLLTPLKSDALKRIKQLLQHPHLASNKGKLIDALDQATIYEKEALTDEEIATLLKWRDDLLGNSYHDRLHRWLGELNDSDQSQVYDEEHPLDFHKIIHDLVQEGHNNPELLQPELEWLVSSEPQRHVVVRFAVELGKMDTNTIWLNEFLPFLPNISYVIAAYLSGRWTAGNEQLVEDYLTEWVQSNPELSLTVLLTLERLESNEERAKWIITLIEKGWLIPENVAWIGNQEWLAPLSDEVFIELLKPLAAKNEPYPTAIALDLIAKWLKSHKEHDVQAADFFVSLLDRVPYDRANRQLTPRGWDNWQYICMFYLRAYTQTIVKAATDLMQYRDAAPIGFKDHRIAVLKAALQGAPELTWGIIGEALLRSEGKYRFWPLRSLDIPKRDQSDTVTLLESVTPDILYKWMDTHKPIAAQTIAQYIHVEQTPLPALARELLIRYGDDEVVRQRLHPSARGSVWSGSYTDRLQKMLEVVRTWLTDENEAIRNWAADIADDIEEAIQQRKPYDDEDDLIYR